MSLSRRHFLGAAAAATVPLLTGSRLPAQVVTSGRLQARDEFGGFPLGVQSYSLRNFDLQQCLRQVQELGLHFVEFYSKHMPLEINAEQLEATRKLLAAAEVRVNAHGVSDFSKDHEANRKIFEFAKRVGIKNLTANPAKDSYDSLDKLCAEYDVRICIHNHGPGALYDKISDVAQIVKDRHPNIGACIDTGHYIRSAEDPVKAVRELKGRVFALHVKDEAEQKPNSHNVIIGQGHLDLVGLFKALRETGFPKDGSISLEYEAKPENPLEDMRACVAAAKAAIAKLA
ncbi:MAG: TIM barrel protein [Planctomycetota bacterium]